MKSSENKNREINSARIAKGEEALSFKNLAEILRENRISKAEFARMMNTSAQNVQNWCKRGVPAIKALEVASTLGVNVSDISPLKDQDSALSVDPEKIKSARDAMTTILELKLLKNLDQRELYKLIGMLDSLPSGNNSDSQDNK